MTNSFQNVSMMSKMVKSLPVTVHNVNLAQGEVAHPSEKHQVSSFFLSYFGPLFSFISDWDSQDLFWKGVSICFEISKITKRCAWVALRRVELLWIAWVCMSCVSYIVLSFSKLLLVALILIHIKNVRADNKVCPLIFSDFIILKFCEVKLMYDILT